MNQTIQATRRHPDAVKAIVLLSGGTDAEGEAFIKANPKLPIFGAASLEDTNAAASIKKIMSLAGHPDNMTQMYNNAGHAASMFAKEADLEPDIVLWLRQAIQVQSYSLRAQ